MTDTHQRLYTFVRYVDEYLKGDEKGEAQIFLDKLLALNLELADKEKRGEPVVGP